jgi:hypothetical protein
MAVSADRFGMQDARFEVERGPGEETTDDGRIKAGNVRLGRGSVFI